MGVEYMSNPPDPRTKDFFASPALSLSLAGIFRGAGGDAGSAAAVVEQGDDVSGGGRELQEDTVELSSENSGPTRSRSDEDLGGGEGENEYDDEDDGDGGDKKKKRKKYHRHTTEQIREMEALFKESPHPDEKQRQQLSKQLGLAPRQVKFWFQNRRTQIKAIQERHENSLLKSEIEKLREENKAMRETIQKARCPKCGFATVTNQNPSATTEEQQLRIENARLKSEVEKLRTAMGKPPSGMASPSSSSLSPGNNNEDNRSSMDGVLGLEKSRIKDIVNDAMGELKKMATAGEPLWDRSIETGREILNYDEYVKEFSVEQPAGDHLKRSIEASRETAVIFVDLPRLIQSFMDANQWKEMFPCLIAKAANVNTISSGEGGIPDGAVQLMFAELQMLTPIVPTRELFFIRYCKQLGADEWAITDVSIDKVEDGAGASVVKCRKRPSGCIIQDKSNGHCKVTWVEHWDCQKSFSPSIFRTILNNGLAFGAWHWMAALQLQCEWLVFFMATNVPTRDSSGVATLAGRKSIMKLAQRMTQSFCRALGSSSHHTWSNVITGDDIRVASRKNLSDPGEPIGLIVCVVSSVLLPASPHVLFEYLRDEAHRSEWDFMSSGGPVQSIANLSKGQDRGNSVTIQTVKSKESVWILQDTCTNAYESMVVYAPVDVAAMQSVMSGCDSTSTTLLPSGFSILPDGESGPLVITSRPKQNNAEGGSLLTIAFQIQTSPSPAAKLSMDSVQTVATLLSRTLQNIKKGLQCEDG